MKKDRIQNKFLDELKEIPIVQVACKRTGLSRQSVYRWRNEDPVFSSLMSDALAEGEEFINDLSESQLLTLIKDKQFSAIRYWLSHHHHKYKKQESAVKTETVDDFDPDLTIKELGLTYEDFSDEKRYETIKRVADYLSDR